MSQQKVDRYKQNKANRSQESKKEIRRRRVEIGILIAVVAAGIIWFAVAGISRSINARTTTVELKTEAIDEYITGLQTPDTGDIELEEAGDDEIVLEEDGGEEIVLEEEGSEDTAG